MQSRGPAAPSACCRANSRTCTRRGDVAGILTERVLFAYGALSNEAWGLGREHKEPDISHTRWDGNDGGEPLAEENHQCIESY